jgi:hypothetical protein
LCGDSGVVRRLLVVICAEAASLASVTPKMPLHTALIFSVSVPSPAGGE